MGFTMGFSCFQGHTMCRPCRKAVYNIITHTVHCIRLLLHVFIYTQSDISLPFLPF